MKSNTKTSSKPATKPAAGKGVSIKKAAEQAKHLPTKSLAKAKVEGTKLAKKVTKEIKKPAAKKPETKKPPTMAQSPDVADFIQKQAEADLADDLRDTPKSERVAQQEIVERAAVTPESTPFTKSMAKANGIPVPEAPAQDTPAWLEAKALSETPEVAQALQAFKNYPAEDFGIRLVEVILSKVARVTPKVTKKRYEPKTDPDSKYNNCVRSTCEKPIEKVKRICAENPGKPRKDVLALCVAAGVNPSTAATQYSIWKQPAPQA